MTSLLQLGGLTRRFAGLVAVDGVDMAVAPGIHAVIGPNGAGKTTLFNLVSGLIAPSSGRIALAGQDVTGLPPEARAGLGVSRTFQAIRVFGGLTVLENVLTGLHSRLSAGPLATVLRLKRFRTSEREAVGAATDALAFVGLAGKESSAASALSYGDQRRLEIARAIAARPRLLMLDEPAAGMNPAETTALATLVRRLRDERGLTVLLVEHDMGFVMDISDRVTVLSFGKKLFEGTAAEVRTAPAVIEAYLGAKVADRLRRRAS